MFVIKTVIFLLACVHFALGIRCYDCTSANNSMCIDPRLYDAETLLNFLPSVECTHGVEAVAPNAAHDFFCRKIVQTIFHKNTGSELRVTRGCGWLRTNGARDCYKADNEDHLETVCQCFTSDCNSAVTQTVSLVVVGILGIIAVIKNLF